MLQTSTSYLFKTLSKADIPSYLRLQEKIAPTVTADGICRIKLRDACSLAAHMAAEMPVLGYVDRQSGELAAAVMATYPDHPAALHMDGYPFAEALTDIFVAQGLYVAPGHQKKGLSHLLLGKAFDAAARDNRFAGYAKIACDRLSSRASFAKSGFREIAGGVDKTFGYDVIFVRRQERMPIVYTPSMPRTLPEHSQFRYI